MLVGCRTHKEWKVRSKLKILFQPAVPQWPSSGLIFSLFLCPFIFSIWNVGIKLTTTIGSESNEVIYSPHFFLFWSYSATVLCGIVYALYGDALFCPKLSRCLRSTPLSLISSDPVQPPLISGDTQVKPNALIMEIRRWKVSVFISEKEANNN